MVSQLFDKFIDDENDPSCKIKTSAKSAEPLKINEKHNLEVQ
jgi:hypothetical protein